MAAATVATGSGCVSFAAARAVSIRAGRTVSQSANGCARCSLQQGRFPRFAGLRAFGAFHGVRQPLPAWREEHQAQFHGRREKVSSGAAVVAQWKQEISWSEASVASIGEAAEQLYSLVVDISDLPDLRKGHTKPGQFVQIKVGESKPAFLAIASPITTAESGSLEFLIKDIEGSTAALLCDLKKGDKLDISPVMGKGFNMDEVSPPEEYSTLLLFATGSGISPVRSLLETGFDAIKRSDVRLYYGARNPSRMAYQDRFKAWEASGVKVVPVYSQPDDSWQGETGFVQAAFARGEEIVNPGQSGAVLCGQKAMAEEVTALLLEKGVAKSKILLNF